MGLGLMSSEMVLALTATGAALLAVYVRYALKAQNPLIDLRLLNLPTFRAGVLGGFLFRLGLGAGPFLLPLLFQNGFGMTPFQSGMMTFATGVGAMFMKTQAATILRRWGYRRVLVANALISAAFTAIPALYTAATPTLLITAIFLIGGLSRSLQFTSINTLAYADVPPEKLSRATSFAAVGQELAGSVGVTVAALGLEVMQRMNGGDANRPGHFPPVFILIALISAASALMFSRLAKDAGVRC